jgi:hypothetical protein
MILPVQTCAIIGMAVVVNALVVRSDGTTTSPTATASMPTLVGPYGQCMNHSSSSFDFRFMRVFLQVGELVIRAAECARMAGYAVRISDLT